jgi:ribose transport system permease protein
MNAKIMKWTGRNVWVWSVFGIIFLWVVISILSHQVSLNSLLLNATLASFLVFFGFGQMVVIASGDGAIDLSIPYIVTLSAYVSSSLMQGGPEKIVLGIIVTLAISVGIGVINGLINVYLKVPAMITTLATGYITFTAILMYAPTTTGTPNATLASFTKLQFHGFSTLLVIAIVIGVVMFVIMYKTKFGKSIHAVGQGRRAAKLAGISVPKVIIRTFALSGALAGLGGILLGAYLGGSYQDMGNSFMLTSIAATLVGGTIASGGKSSVAGTMGGALMMTLIVTFINLTKLSAGFQDLIEGAILILILVASVSKSEAA